MKYHEGNDNYNVIENYIKSAEKFREILILLLMTPRAIDMFPTLTVIMKAIMSPHPMILLK